MVNDQKDFKKIANNLKKQKEILAVEWLDKKKVFGDKASLDEMSAFKSRVKRQDVKFDPENQKTEEQKRQEEEEKMQQHFEELKAAGKVRTPVPYQGDEL